MRDNGGELRRRFVRAIAAVATMLGRLGVTPNMLTFGSLVPAIASGIAAAEGALLLSAGLVILSGVCDLLDGSVARATGLVSKTGALLDSTFDRICDAAPFLGLIVFYANHGWLSVIPALALLWGYTVSYVRARAEGLGIELPPLWMRRPGRVILTAFALAAGGIALPIGVAPAPLTLAVTALIAVLSFLASVHAVCAANRALKQPRSEE